MADNFAYEVTGPGSDLFGVIDLHTGVFTSLGDTRQTLAGLGSYQRPLAGHDARIRRTLDPSRHVHGHGRRAEILEQYTNSFDGFIETFEAAWRAVWAEECKQKGETPDRRLVRAV
jgi:hypothetical protein